MIELRRRYSGIKGSDSPSFSRLPAGYQEVEYLESTGTQYIELEKTMSADITKIILEYEMQTGSIVNYLISAASNSAGFLIGYRTDLGKARIFFGDNVNPYGDFEMNTGKSYRLEIAANHTTAYLKLNGENVLVLDGIIFNNRNIKLLHYFGNSGIFKLKYVKIECSKDIELIPCYRKYDDTAGMYDLVSGEFYTNAGTGEFIVGPEIIG